MSQHKVHIINPTDIEPRLGTSYPDEHKGGSESRIKHVVGDALGLTQYGVNIVTLPPGGESALQHWHTVEDEFVYIISGELTLVSEAGENVLQAGMTAGFPGGEENGHHLVNKSGADATYLEVGTRLDNDEVYYPGKDLSVRNLGNGRAFHTLDGKPY